MPANYYCYLRDFFRNDAGESTLRRGEGSDRNGTLFYCAADHSREEVQFLLRTLGEASHVPLGLFWAEREPSRDESQITVDQLRDTWRGTYVRTVLSVMDADADMRDQQARCLFGLALLISDVIRRTRPRTDAPGQLGEELAADRPRSEDDSVIVVDDYHLLLEATAEILQALEAIEDAVGDGLRDAQQLPVHAVGELQELREEYRRRVGEAVDDFDVLLRQTSVQRILSQVPGRDAPECWSGLLGILGDLMEQRDQLVHTLRLNTPEFLLSYLNWEQELLQLIRRAKRAQRELAEAWQALSGHLARKDAPWRDAREELFQETECAAGGQTDASTNLPVAEPPKRAIQAWRIRKLLGIENQAEIAAKMCKMGAHATQGQVSRWLQQAETFLAAGGVFPELKPSAKKLDIVDPNVLDMGARQDGRTPRQRERRDSDE